MIPEQLALLLIMQKNHNKRFGEFEFEYIGDSDVVNKLLDQTASKFNLITTLGDGCRQKTLPQRLCQVLPVSHEFDSCLPEQS